MKESISRLIAVQIPFGQAKEAVPLLCMMLSRLTWNKLASGCVIGVRPWEVNPLWMAKLIAHEVEVALASEHSSDQPDHLVQGDTSARVSYWPINRHAVIHVLVHEPEGDGLVPHQRLHAVRFSI